MRPPFSERTKWDLRPNRITLALSSRKQRGEEVIDLTESNPTCCGLEVPGAAIMEALGRREALSYQPDPRGRLAAREAVAALYAARGTGMAAERIVLTASTSEAYAHLFRLLADPGDEVLVPAPAYPLFDYLAGIEDLRLRSYPLVEPEGFRIDRMALEEGIGERTRAILVVSPGNPTGTYLREDDLDLLVSLCSRHGLALVADEVFGDYAFAPEEQRLLSAAGEERALTFVLNGISKMLALPQMKLGWIAASGPEEILREALGRLEVIADTFLSVGTPIQAALPSLLDLRESIQRPIRERIASNLAGLEELLPEGGSARALPAEGGWSAVIKVPATHSDEAWALKLLEEDGVLVHPGFFFDFPREGHLVVSLLPEVERFREGVRRLAARMPGRE